MLHSSLFAETVQLAIDDRLLILNSAADAFVPLAAQRIPGGELVLAEDNLAALHNAQKALRGDRHQSTHVRHIPFHEYTLHEASATINIALMNILYQPANAWIQYGLQLAAYALKPGGRLYVQGAKDRGILSLAKHMQTLFGNVETLEISKGERVVCSTVSSTTQGAMTDAKEDAINRVPTLFAGGKLDEGTCLLLEALEVRVTDVALDLGCGAGYIGAYIARHATKGQVTMVDASLAAVDAARHMIEENGLTNAQVLPGDGAQDLLEQRFDLVVTNPPFHVGGIQTTEIAERFIREAAKVLRPRGRFYLVANRFLKYEPIMRECFKVVEEVAGNTRFKVL
ncbi:MAG TPA: methyltransferase, partial [Ktedonobacteraceae bacterium]|nr:methyltransferase [Ktedonobacteraceae bacterium]